MKKLLLTAALLFLPLAAQAATDIFSLPFGTVTLTQSGTNVTFSVVLAPGLRFIETASGGAELFLFNDSLAGSVITSPTAAPTPPASGLSGFTNLPPVSTATAGSFTASVECTVALECDGVASPLMTSLSFTVTNATLAELETVNGAGNAFFADTAVIGTTSVPEPSTLLMLGVGLAGLALAKWRQTA